MATLRTPVAARVLVASAALSAGALPAHARPIVYGGATPVATNTRSQWAPGAGPTYSLGADVRFVPGGAWTTRSTFGFKAAGATPATANSPTVWNAAATAGGFGQNNYSWARAGFWGGDITYNWSIRTGFNVPAVAPFVETVAWHGDPFQHTVGDVNSTFEFDQVLKAGATVQARDAAHGANPALNMTFRLGFGSNYASAQEDPAWFWNNTGATIGTAPTGGGDFYLLSIFEDAAGQLQAGVSPGVPTLPSGMSASLYSLASSSPILAAGNWSKSNGVWTLANDVPLVNLRLTNSSSGNMGMQFAIGSFASNVTAVPAPGPVALAGLGLLLAVRRRRR